MTGKWEKVLFCTTRFGDYRLIVSPQNPIVAERLGRWAQKVVGEYQYKDMPKYLELVTDVSEDGAFFGAFGNLRDLLAEDKLAKIERGTRRPLGMLVGYFKEGERGLPNIDEIELAKPLMIEDLQAIYDVAFDLEAQGRGVPSQQREFMFSARAPVSQDRIVPLEDGRPERWSRNSMIGKGSSRSAFLKGAAVAGAIIAVGVASWSAFTRKIHPSRDREP